MKKEFAIGLVAIATVGLGVGVMLASKNADTENLAYQGTEIGTSPEDKTKLEELYFEELKNTDRYSFCTGRETITGTYENSIMGTEKGTVLYTSEELNLFDRDANKLYILGRTVRYTYDGKSNIANGVGTGEMVMRERGELSEYYKKNTALVRVDFTTKIFFPAPTGKTTNWVTTDIQSSGTVLGATQRAEEVTYENPKVFCGPISFADKPLSAEILGEGSSFTFDERCPAQGGILEASFTGDEKFTCIPTSTNEAIELLKTYEENETSGAGAEDTQIEDALKSTETGTPSTEDIKKQLQGLEEEMGATRE
jgi:hypothetical protein